MRWLSDGAVERLRAAADEPDLTGTHYRLVGYVDRGGMGAVYCAEDERLGRQVALKVLGVPEPGGELSERLVREARVLARLEHPGIVPVHDLGTLADGRTFYTMKLVEGQRLDQHISRVPALSDRLRVFQRICEAVAFAHARGVLHRDLKPQNVMVGPFGEVLVMDWGLAKVLVEASAPLRPEADAEAPQPAPGATSPGTILGTPGYMAPEQLGDNPDAIDARADVFALGAILRFLISGKLPDRWTTAGPASPPASSFPSSGAPAPLVAIARQAMASDRDQRYPSATELSAEVGRFLDGRPVSAYPEGVVRRVARLGRRHRVALMLLLSYLVVRTLLILWTR